MCWTGPTPPSGSASPGRNRPTGCGLARSAATALPSTKEIAGLGPSPCLGLDRGDQAGRRPGAGGVPEANAQRPALGDLQPAGLELPGVRARVADVGDRQLATLPEHPGRLAPRLCALARARAV